MDRAHALLEFWFGAPDTPDYGRPRAVWFKKDADFDADLRAGFLADQQQAAAGHHDSWMQTPDGCLALVLLLDQLPRNLYRGTPAAFSCDERARAVARHALDQGYDQDLPSVRRSFFYLPFEHSENLADQEASVALCRTLPADGYSAKALDYAIRHRDIIRRFGRFPHRNDILGRSSTQEEDAFLREPGSSF
jgi:uncharacterized protein (DUF924 family)